MHQMKPNPTVYSGSKDEEGVVFLKDGFVQLLQDFTESDSREKILVPRSYVEITSGCDRFI